MKQSDNEKMRKFKNRYRNVLQRVKKFFRLHMFPVVLSVAIIGGVVFGSYYRVYATGMEELFYYTYFDLMSGLFAETGMDFALKDDYYTKSDRVSGKQVWDNFCTWVENKAKVATLPVEIVNKTVFDELKNLPNTVTSAGAKMSEKLSELLAKEESPSAGYDAGMRKKPVVGSGIWRFKKLWEKSQHLYLYERWNPGYPAGRGASMPISCQRQTVPSGFGVWGFDSLGNLHDISTGSAPVCRS